MPRASATSARRCFPRALFDAVLDALDADILTVRHRGEPVASVLSLYHGDAVLPYWGGGTRAARACAPTSGCISN
jgi:hypothetical protein